MTGGESVILTGLTVDILENVDASVLTVTYRLIGLALLAALVSGSVSFFFRWRTGTQLPEGPALLLGLGAVAVYLNTNIVLVQFLGANGEVLTASAIVSNLSIFAVSLITAAAGWQFGDRFGQSERFHPSIHPNLGPLVRATGRVITVDLPEEVGHIDGYESVSKTTREALAGQTYTFPRGVTVGTLEDELVTRIKTDYDVAHVDVEVSIEGRVEFLAVGGRATGIGPTLPPEATATAITADPAFSASPGDTVQIWDSGQRVGTAELRATAGRTVTVAGEASIIEKLDPTKMYRLMTLPAAERVDRLFAGMLRRAAETMGTVTIEEGTTLDGETVGRLGLPVIAIERPDGTTETIPARDRHLEANERLFVLGHPTYLRRVEAATTGTETYEPPEVTPANASNRRPWHRLRKPRR